MNNFSLERLLNNLLSITTFKDYVPNGLQVEGRAEVKKIITGVTACQALLNEAVAWQADAIIVHHGYFWKNEPTVIHDMKRNRLKTLLQNDINLYSYHLPLDAHPSLGNNAQLAQKFGISHYQQGEEERLLFYGELQSPSTPAAFKKRVEEQLKHPVLHCGEEQAPNRVKQIAWCCGGGQSMLYAATRLPVSIDAFVSGEISEQTTHIARECGIHFFAAGHHATERYGIQALGEWLQQQSALKIRFVDIDNPA